MYEVFVGTNETVRNTGVSVGRGFTVHVNERNVVSMKIWNSNHALNQDNSD